MGEKAWQVFLPVPGETGTNKGWYDYGKLVAVIGLVGLLVYTTGGYHSSYKLLFLPVILVFSLRYGMAWGAVAFSLAGAAIFWFAWRDGPGLVRNPVLEADLVAVGVFYLTSWLVARPFQELRPGIVVLERKESLAALGKVVAAAAHEIKNPLTTLRGCLQIMQYSLRDRDPEWYREQAESFQIMLAEIDRVNKIVSDLLLFTRPLSPRKQLVNLNQVAREMGVFLNSRALLKGIELEVQQCREVHPVEVDPDQLKQVILNIVGNALEILPPGGLVRLAVKEKGCWVRLEISDNGPGIPREELVHIFEPFYTRGKNNGLGLGLAISRRLVEGNGGRLSVGSELGRGTIFTVEFPGVDTATGMGMAEGREGGARPLHYN